MMMMMRNRLYRSMLVTYKNKSVYKSHLIDINVLDGLMDVKDKEIIFINIFIGLEIEGLRFIGICVIHAVGQISWILGFFG